MRIARAKINDNLWPFMAIYGGLKRSAKRKPKQETKQLALRAQVFLKH